MPDLKQYCVYKSKGLSRLIPYLIVLQHDGFSNLDDFVAAPVVKAKNIPGIPVINPIIQINDKPYIAQIEKLSALHKSNFGDFVLDCDGQYYEFVSAIDRLFSGI